jgi:hypothetical protein
VPGDTLPFASRLVLAFVVFFRVLFDGVFAARTKLLEVGSAPATKRSSQVPEPAPVPSADLEGLAGARSDGALALLALFQREGRLVDFLKQEIASFPDADIGAAARVVHDGCRRALASHIEVARVRTEPEGSAVTVPAGFDAAAVKLTGNVSGAAPYKGTLRHSGWRAERVRLPERAPGHDAAVVFPAEVEL